MADQYKYDYEKKKWIKVSSSTPSRGETNRNGRSSTTGTNKSGSTTKTSSSGAKTTTSGKTSTGSTSSSRTYSRGETSRSTTTSSTPKYNTYSQKTNSYSYSPKNSTTRYSSNSTTPSYTNRSGYTSGTKSTAAGAESSFFDFVQMTWDKWGDYLQSISSKNQHEEPKVDRSNETEDQRMSRAYSASASHADLDKISMEDIIAGKEQLERAMYNPGAQKDFDFAKFQTGKMAQHTGKYRDNVYAGVDALNLTDEERKKWMADADAKANAAGQIDAMGRAYGGDMSALNGLTGKERGEVARAGRLGAYNRAGEAMKQQLPEEMQAMGTTPVDIPAGYDNNEFGNDIYRYKFGEDLDGRALTTQERQAAKKRVEMVSGVEDLDKVSNLLDLTYDPKYLEDMQKLNNGKETYQDVLESTSQYNGGDIDNDILVLRDYHEGHVKRSPDEVQRAANRIKAATGVDVLNAENLEAAFDQAVQTNEGLRDAVAQAVYSETGKLPNGLDFNLDEYMMYMNAYARQQNRADREWAEQAQFDDTIQQKYGEYMNAPTFESNSQPISLDRPPANEAEMLHEIIVGIDDPDVFDQLVAKNLDSSWGDDGYFGLSAEMEKYNASTITPEQRKMYNFLWNSGMQDEAVQYIKDIDWSVRKAIAGKTEEVSKQLSEGPVGGAAASLATILSGPARAAVVPFNTARMAMGEDIDQYDQTFNVGRANDKIRGNVGQNLDELLGGANIAGWNIGSGVYQGLMSVADNWMLYGLGENLGGAVMGGEAADTAMRTALENGRGDLNALRDAYAQWGIEGVTEKMGMDKLFGEVGNPLKYVVTNAFAEAGEEVSSGVMSMIYDTAMYGNDSDLGRLRDELITKGYLKGDLNWQLIKQVAGQVRDAMFGGLIGGAGGAAPGAITTSVGDRSSGKYLQQNDAAESVLDFAQKMLPEGDIRNMASNLLGQIKEGGKVANAELGRVFRELLANVDEHTRQILDGTMLRNVRDQLREMGVDDRRIAEAVNRIVAGDGSATPEDYVAVATNDAAHAVTKSLTDQVSYVSDLNKQVGEFAEKAAKPPKPPKTKNTEQQTKENTEEAPAAETAEDEFGDEEFSDDEFDGEPMSETSVTSDGEEVSVVGAESVDADGELVFKVQTADGTEKTVKASDVTLGLNDSDAVVLARAAQEYGASAASMFNARTPGQDAAEYAAAFKKAVQYGADGMNKDTIASYDSVKMLNQNQLGIAYEIGRAERNMRSELSHKSMVEKMTANGPVKVGNVDISGVNVSGLNQHQRRSIVVMRNLAELLGINIEFTESVANERGKYTTENGHWDPSTLTLMLDVHAGVDYKNDVKYAMMHTASHELTHFIFQFADAKVRDDYINFVLGSAVNGQRMTEEKLEAEIQRYLRMKGVKNRDDAIEEIVAEASVEALSKMTEEDIQNLAEENPRLARRIARKIYDWVSKMKAKIAKAFAGTEAKNDYAKMMNDQLDELAKKWNAALLNAVQNKNQIQRDARLEEAKRNLDGWTDDMTDADDVYEDDGVIEVGNADLDAITDDEFWDKVADGADVAVDAENELKFSLREDERLMQAATDANAKNGYVEEGVLKAAEEARAKVAAFMRDDSRDLNLPEDLMGNTFFSDAAYGGSEENTTVCPRSIGADAFLDAVSDSLGRPLTVAEQVRISQDIISAADIKDPQCVYCYVAADRAAYREFLGKYIEQRDSVVEALKSGESDLTKLYETFLNGRKDTPNMKRRFKLWVDTVQSGKRLLSASDLANIGVLTAIQSDKYKQLSADKNFAAQMKDALAYAQSASWAKKRVNYVAYNGHIQKWQQARIDKLNSMYGLRMYSFSDFSPAFALENMQMVTDASVRGLKMLAYTKVADFAKIFAKTGMNINVSVFATEVKGDSGSSIVENNLMGADWKESQKLRAEHPNIGITFVATSDAQIEWALDQDWIDVVIPYHLVRTGRTIAEMMKYKNYTAESSDVKTPEWSKANGNLSSIPAALHNNDRDTYMRLLEENNLTPRFARFVDHPNYMKLVNETRQSVTTSQPVQPIFDTDAAINALQNMANNGGYYVPIGGSEQRMYELANEFAEKVNRGEYKDTASESEFADDGVKYQARLGGDKYDFAKPFAEQVDDWVKGIFPEKETLVIGTTPRVMRDVGFPAIPLTFDQKHMREILGKPKNADHDLGIEFLKALPEHLNNPVAIIQNAEFPETGVRIVFAAKNPNANNNQIIAIANVDGGGQINGISIDATRIKTTHSNGQALAQLEEAIKKEDAASGIGVYYWNKKEALSLVRPGQVTSLGRSLKSGFIHSIQETGSPVKMRITKQTDTSQFRRWFKGSKVVNEDGSPKVMYHGTSSYGFDSFDTYGGRYGLMGMGSYFTDNAEVAEGYTKNGRGSNPGVYEVYLSVKNPIDMDAKAGSKLARAWEEYFNEYLLSDSKINGDMTNEQILRVVEEALRYDEGMTVSEVVELFDGFYRSQGFDGITHIGGGRFHAGNGVRHRVVIAFEPEQVKSATDNIGTFDPEDANIYHQLRDPDQVSDRELLANVMDSAAETQAELDFVRRYRKQIEQLDQKQRELEQVGQEIIQARKDKARKSDIAVLQEKSKILRKQLDRMDGKLLEFEAGKPLQAVVKRQRAELQEKARERTRKLVEEVRKKDAAYREKLLTGLRDRKNESFARQKYLAEVKAGTDKLREMVTTPTNKKHVPEILRKPMAEFLDAFDFASKRQLEGGEPTKADRRMADAYDAMRKAIERMQKHQSGIDTTGAEYFSGYLDLPNSYIEEFDNIMVKVRAAIEASGRISDTPIHQMKSEDLHELAKLLRILHSSINKMNKTLANAKYATADAAAEDSMADLDEVKMGKERIKLFGKMVDFIDWKNATPYYAFERFGRGGKAIFESLMNGWDKLAFNAQKLVDFTKSVYKPSEVAEWERDVKDVKLSSGETVRMSAAQLMSIYCLAKRAQAVGHLMGGGIRVADIDGKRGKTISQTDNYTLNEEDLEAMRNLLNDRQREVADKLQADMVERGAKWGNEVSMKRFGYKMFTEPNYFPVESDKNNMQEKDEEVQENSLLRLLNMSATKDLTKNATNAIVIRSIFDVYTSHMSDMAKYNALGLQILDAMKWLNYVERTDEVDKNGEKTGKIKTRSVRKSLENAYGAEARRYIVSFIRNLNGDVEAGLEDGIFNRMTSNYKIAAVGANLRVGMLQITSMPRAATVIDPKYLMAGLAKWNARRGKTSKQAIEKVGIAKWKSMGFYDTNISRNLRQMIKHDETTIDKVREGSMKLAEWGDAWTMGVLYGAVESELLHTEKKLAPGTEAWDKRVNERMREIIYRTQVVDSTMTRSHLMRQKGAISGALAFMSEPTLTLNMLNDAIFKVRMDARQGKKWNPATAKTVAKVMAVTATVNVFAAIVEALFSALRDDDEFEKFSEKYMTALLGDYSDAETFGDRLSAFMSGSFGSKLNLLDNIPVVSDIIDAAKSGAADQMWQAFAGEIGEGYRAMMKVMREGGSLADYYRAVYKLMGGASKAVGLPVSNAMRDVVSIYNTIVAEPMGWRRLQTYENTNSEAAAALLEAQIAGDDRKTAKVRERIAAYNMDQAKIAQALAKQAEEAYAMGRIDRSEAEAYMTGDGGKRSRQVKEALLETDYEIETGLEYGNMKADFISGVLSESDARKYLKKYDGLRDKKIDERIKQWQYEKSTGLSYSNMKWDYIDGELTDSEVKSYRMKYGGADEAAVETLLGGWQYEKDTGLLWGELKLDYADGVISESKLRDYLKVYGGKDEEAVEETINNYDFQIATGRTGEAPKYWRIAHARETGGDYKAYADEAFQKIMYGGETKRTYNQARNDIARSLAGYYKYYYLPIAGTAEGNAMLERILDVYEAIGYSRSYEREYIAENWFED